MLVSFNETVDETGIKDWIKHNSKGKDEVSWPDLDETYRKPSEYS